jgi:hypothetical protein
MTALKKFVISTPTTAAAVDAACLTDWIQIPCATDQQSSTQLLSDGTTACVSKICGAAFSAKSGATAPAPVYSTQFLSLEHFLIKIHKTKYITVFNLRLSQAVRGACVFQQLRPNSGRIRRFLPQVSAAVLHFRLKTVKCPTSTQRRLQNQLFIFSLFSKNIFIQQIKVALFIHKTGDLNVEKNPRQVRSSQPLANVCGITKPIIDGNCVSCENVYLNW